MTHYSSVEQLQAAVGAPEEVSDWILIDQDRIDRFADATGDHQWIHVDSERAAAGPFGGTIAHGYLSLSIIPIAMFGMLELDGSAMVINYGLDRLRLPSPVPSGSRVRVHAGITAADLSPQGLRVTQHVTVEIEGKPKPAAVADTISLFVLDGSPSI